MRVSDVPRKSNDLLRRGLGLINMQDIQVDRCHFTNRKSANGNFNEIIVCPTYYLAKEEVLRRASLAQRESKPHPEVYQDFPSETDRSRRYLKQAVKATELVRKRQDAHLLPDRILIDGKSYKENELHSLPDDVSKTLKG